MLAVHSGAMLATHSGVCRKVANLTPESLANLLRRTHCFSYSSPTAKNQHCPELVRGTQGMRYRQKSQVIHIHFFFGNTSASGIIKNRAPKLIC